MALKKIKIKGNTYDAWSTSANVAEAKNDIDSKLGDVEDALEYMEGGGLPDIAAIAKQGTNASATLTATQAAVVDGNDTAISVSKEIRSEVGTGSDTAAETGTLFAVLKWVKDKVKSIFNLIGSPASGQPSTLFAAIAAGGGGGSAADIQLFVEKFRAAGLDVPEDATLMQLYDKVDDYSVLMQKDFSVEEGATTLLDLLANQKYFTLTIPQNYTLLYSAWPIFSYIKIRELYAPLQYGGYYISCRYMYDLRIADLRWTNMPIGQYAFQHCSKLIDLRIGYNFNSNINFVSAFYPQVEPISDASSTLVESGETFANNREKWNWCLREHMAAYLPDRTGETAYTLTFGSTAIAAMEQETINAFTAKNWTLA